MTKYELTRDVTRTECHWLDRDYKAGEHVFEYTGYTYGCVTPSGIAITARPGETPFHELPADALRPFATQEQR